MSDAVDRLAQAPHDLINEAAQAAIEQQRPTPPARVVERPNVSKEDFALCPWCNKKHMRHLTPVNDARQQLDDISRTTFYALVKAGELSLVKIGRRLFIQAEELDDSLRRKRYDPSG
ncbi:helix-turn-helix domain-containing protein [Mycobacterium sp.]|uniref:helix-turn-helix domain-containing protein n=1 Tax=Mycobacterium sp. TaxID=1785 RepID=UPI003C7476BB